MYKPHQSVLYRECLTLLSPALKNQDMWMVDATFGAGGHSRLFLEEFSALKIIGVDQDLDAQKNAKEFIAQHQYSERIRLIHANMVDVFSLPEMKGITPHIILADLGVSSHQFDEPSRGFSFRFDGPLDMRMNQQSNLTAAKVVNTYSEAALLKLFKEYGEEPFAKVIASKIVTQRETTPLETTKQLEEICFLSYPKTMRHKSRHPATLVFQALRLEVNQELEVLKNVIDVFYEHLAPGGKLGIISFHSLEDRIVKHKFLELAAPYKSVGKKNYFREKESGFDPIVTKKPVTAMQDELSFNPRSRSAKLRVIQKP
jgi:16S rRNA (cytosine1402-N4)-methyltransferase